MVGPINGITKSPTEQPEEVLNNGALAFAQVGVVKGENGLRGGLGINN